MQDARVIEVGEMGGETWGIAGCDLFEFAFAS